MTTSEAFKIVREQVLPRYCGPIGEALWLVLRCAAKQMRREAWEAITNGYPPSLPDGPQKRRKKR